MAGETWIGGFHAVASALENAAGAPVRVVVARHREDARTRRVLELAQARSVPVERRPQAELDLLAPGLRHQGVLALLAGSAPAGDDLLSSPATPDRMLLVLDGVQDPHNLGACLRTAEAAGAAGVIVPKDRAAGLTPAARKAAAGAAERLPLVAVTNLARTLAQLKERGYWVTGLAGDAAESLYDTDLTGPLVLALGAEGDGLRRLTRERCDRLVRIPMQGQAESLNVSVAAAICLYEALRQRKPDAGRLESPPRKL